MSSLSLSPLSSSVTPSVAMGLPGWGRVKCRGREDQRFGVLQLCGGHPQRLQVLPGRSLWPRPWVAVLGPPALLPPVPTLLACRALPAPGSCWQSLGCSSSPRPPGGQAGADPILGAPAPTPSCPSVPDGVTGSLPWVSIPSLLGLLPKIP